ncbi:MAG TPA: hypothetical protein VMT54_14880 [Candidatus Cybelea sp.]|nr:hypothetical protein [Candidatus Cybelea sp.]
MLLRSSLLAGLGLALIATPALAQAVKPPVSAQQLAARCSTLETQFAQALAKAGNAPGAAQAQRDGSRGQAYCTSGRPSDGAVWLRRAIRDLGETPLD